MNAAKRFVYDGFITALRAYRKLFLDVRIGGRHHIPPGPKIFVTNHIASTDGYWVLPVFPEPVHVIVGPGYQSKPLGRLLDWLEQINAMPEHRKTVVDKAVAYLRRGESVYTTPEGDIQESCRLGRFYPGVAKMYRKFPAPIIPIAMLAPRRSMRRFPRLDFDVEGRVYRCVMILDGPYFINVGGPFRPMLDEVPDESADNERIVAELRDRMQDLIDEIRSRPSWRE